MSAEIVAWVGAVFGGAEVAVAFVAVVVVGMVWKEWA